MSLKQAPQSYLSKTGTNTMHSYGVFRKTCKTAYSQGTTYSEMRLLVLQLLKQNNSRNFGVDYDTNGTYVYV